MDIELEKKINETLEHLKAMMPGLVDYDKFDPIAKMMLVALLHETQKINDYLENIDQKIAERFCEDFIPRQQTEAMPAIALVAPKFKKNKNEYCVEIAEGVSFTYKTKTIKAGINYLPLFKEMMMPYDNIYVLTRDRLTYGGHSIDISNEQPNTVWIGIQTEAEIETLNGFALFIQKNDNVYPHKVSVHGSKRVELDFCTMNRFEDIDMLEPFDAQQASGTFLSIIDYWKKNLQELPGGVLLVITDKNRDRDLFKKRAYPRIFQNYLESETLNCFGGNTIWLQLDFPEGYVVHGDLRVVLNAIPIANVGLNSITLTQASPVAKLQGQDNSFFISVVETSETSQSRGFPMADDEFVIRDFDACGYHHGSLYRDVRNLYNRFVEDYYAFMEYSGLKDGQDIKRLKEIVNKIAKGVGEVNDKFKYDSGTYAMRNISKVSANGAVKVSFITTQGNLGNQLGADADDKSASRLECKKMPIMETTVPVVVGAFGGRDKATVDQRYEQLRYYTLTNDRLFTKMDIEAFVRKELVAVYGKEEFKRISVNIRVEGAGAQCSLKRGLYVDIEFKDKKNYNMALEKNLKYMLHRAIKNRSCITMPIIISLFDLEEA